MRIAALLFLPALPFLAGLCARRLFALIDDKRENDEDDDDEIPNKT